MYRHIDTTIGNLIYIVRGMQDPIACSSGKCLGLGNDVYRAEIRARILLKPVLSLQDSLGSKNTMDVSSLVEYALHECVLLDAFQGKT